LAHDARKEEARGSGLFYVLTLVSLTHPLL